MVYYRKYRPQNISELDLAAVREKLSSILRAGEIPHAFLFTGPKGLGKTSSARILAKAINCERLASSKLASSSKDEKLNAKRYSLNAEFEPCNKCDACTSITNGSNLDVIEIDAASNRGIDEIRDLREKIKFAPASLPRKVYIIDEVHMLTTDAFNALLKTLEEPPSHAIFILCTTEVEKVPATIASRTFHVQFQKPTREELVHSLERIVKGEKLDVEKGVLEDIFGLSEGAFRDAAKILEELNFASKDGKVTKEIIESSFKTGSTNIELRKLLDALAAKDIQTSMKIIDQLSQKGSDFKVVTENLAKMLHDALLACAGIMDSTFDIPAFPSQNEMSDLVGRVNASYKDIKFSVLPQIPLELVVVGWCLENETQEQVAVRSSKAEEKKEEIPQVASRKPQVEEKETKNENRTPTIDEQKPTSEKHGGMFRDNAKSHDFFAELLARVKSDNHSIAGILRGCRLIEIADGQAIFETKFKFHKDKLSESKARNVLDKRATEILRENIRVVVNLVEK